MQRKTAAIDLDQSGSFRAIIAKLNTVDRDGDVIFKDAMPSGKSVPVSAYGHTSWGGALPIGRGVLGSDEMHAFVEGRLFLDTTDGREAHKTLRHLGRLAQWSFGYDVKRAVHPGAEALRPFPKAKRGLLELDLHEVSPVLLAAGINTGTQYIKSAAVYRATDPALMRLREEFYELTLPLYLGIRTAQLP